MVHIIAALLHAHLCINGITVRMTIKQCGNLKQSSALLATVEHLTEKCFQVFFIFVSEELIT